MKKELTTEECMEIFKKYDQGLYEYYQNNMHLFGWNARNYAKHLLTSQSNTRQPFFFI